MQDDLNHMPPTRALHYLEERRHFLERLVAAAGTIEALKHSMENMLDQGSRDGGESPHMARFIESLGRKVRNLSDAEVRLRLEKLDRRLRRLFKTLTPIIEHICAGDTAIEDMPLAAAEDDVGTLKRVAQTALALRGLLARRGIEVPDLRLPLDRGKLKAQLSTISHEEQGARRSVIQQVRALGGELRQMLARDDLPQSMVALLEQMMAGLRENLAHLKAGKSVLELPLDIESVSFLETPAPSGSTPITSSEANAEAGTEPAALSPYQAPESTAINDGAEVPPAGPRPNLFKAFRIWISSPWNVTWQDIREGRYRG
ncbi:hypothetical protein QQM79_04960 [Marinobacteraceae bacterium S3BR75-40.1]